MNSAADAVQARAEVLKLARILGREATTVAYLEQLELADLRQLREQVTEVLWSDHGQALNRLAAASRLLPAAVSASISQRAFGPLLSARLAGLLEPGRAVAVATRLPPAFLADVAIELDPRRASEVIAQIPPDRIAQATGELLAREEYVTMGRFVGHLSDGSLAAAVSAMDDRALLRITFVLEDKQGLDHVIGVLSPQRRAGLVPAAADDDLWIEVLDLLTHLSEGPRDEIAAAARDLEPAALEALVGAVIEHDLWDEVLAIAQHDVTLQDSLAQRFATLPQRRRRAVARRARDAGTIDQLGRLGEALATP